MQNQYTISSQTLEDSLGASDIRVLDCSVHINVDANFNLSFKSGIHEFGTGHIPGAQFLDIVHDVSHPDRPGSFELPEQAPFEDAMRSLGISSSSQIILYSATSYQWATRAWWLLRLFGFDKVTILNGGFQKWTREERPISTRVSNYERGDFLAAKRSAYLADKTQVHAAIAQGSTCIVNALSPEMYSGQSPLHFGRKGHITSSINLWMREFVDPETNEFLPAASILKKLDDAGVLSADSHIAYCGKGVSATANAFAMALAGLPNVAVYNGSMEEWAADTSMPMTSLVD